MSDSRVTFFPVGNGDSTLIQLSDDSAVLVDCNFTQDSLDPAEPSRYDVRAFLLDQLRRDSEGTPHLDVFVLTHPDTDHCRGFEDVFYLGDPAKLSAQDRENDLIVVDEIWFAPRLFLPYDGKLTGSAKAFLKEAKRRTTLFTSKDKSRTTPGNRVRVIGYSDSDKLDGLESVLTVPGNTVNVLNGKDRDDFEFFVHGPLKDDTDNESGERNDSSIILQARFRVDQDNRAGLVLLGGDASSTVWNRVVELSDVTDLEWDILLAPHHCSWYFFSETSYSDDPTPGDSSLDLLEMHRDGAWVIASSKPIENDDDDPPSFQASKLYKESVGKRKFLCTGEYPNKDNPEPILFTMTIKGPTKGEVEVVKGARSSSVVNAVLGKPKTYGQY